MYKLLFVHSNSFKIFYTTFGKISDISTMSTPSLWQRMKSGEQQALRQIYDEYVDLLYQYGAKFTPAKELVQDCIQDIFVDIWNNRLTISDTDNIKKYLLVAVRNRIFRQLSRVETKYSTQQPEESHFEATLAIDEILAQQAYSEERLQALKTAFEALSKRQQEAIYLKYYSDLEYESICEVMGVSYQSARNLVSGGLKILRDILLCWLCMILF